MNRLLRLFLLTLMVLSLVACATTLRRYPAPEPAKYVQAKVVGFNNIRYWKDQRFPKSEIDRMVEQYRKYLTINPALAKRFDILALSGGADDGAYGAGFLKGWTERGNRPEFTIVTGISTGALIAPFAFLGPEYDEHLKRFYTETRPKDIVTHSLKNLLGGTALVDTAPLRRTLEDQIDERLVAAIAREHNRGRVLLIGTTNLDAQRSVIWDIGQIAASGRKEAPVLIRDIMLASASIPGVFPPVTIDVVIDGVRHQEIHVDGGVTHEIFVYPPGLRPKHFEKGLGIKPKKSYWLVRNTKINPEYKKVEAGLSSIAGRSINTLIKYQGRGDLVALKKLSERDGFDFNLTFVPASFCEPSEHMFDQNYMRKLYDVGQLRALSEKPWESDLQVLLAESD